MSIPRNANGWPTVEPKFFTYAELLAEARRWRGGDPGTVAGAKWDLYVQELFDRGFMTAVERQEGILPDELPGPRALSRHIGWLKGESTYRAEGGR